MCRAVVCCIFALSWLAGCEKEPAPKPRRPDARTRALLIGCTEYPVLKQQRGEKEYKRRHVGLRGAVFDLGMMRRLLEGYLGCRPENIRELGGWFEKPSDQPTASNIRSALKDLARDAQRGELVVIHYSGHGAQQLDQKAGEEGRDEADGKDEILCPQDIGRSKSGRFPNAITDDELGVAVRAIRDKGAKVWLFLDCCCSGTALRAAPLSLVQHWGEVTPRYLDAETLGAQVASATSLRSSDRPAEGALDDRGDLAGIVAMYAAQSFTPTLEVSLKMDGATTYVGVFTYTLGQLIERLAKSGGNATFAELHAGVVAAYAGLSIPGLPTPGIEGERQFTLFGAAATERLFLTARGDGRLELNAGRLLGIEQETVVAIHAPGARAADPVARGRITRARLMASDCSVVGKWSPAKGKVYPARIVSQPLGGNALRVAVVDREGAALPNADIPAPVAELLKARKARYPQTEPSAADCWIQLAGKRIGVRPEVGQTAAIPADPDSLGQRLDRVYKVRNLKRLAASGVLDPWPRKLRFEVHVRRHGVAPFVLRPGGRLLPGDQVRVTLRNATKRTYDVTLLLLTARYEVAPIFPASFGRGSPRLTDKDTEPIESDWFTVEDDRGQESLLAIAIPRRPDDPELDFSGLAESGDGYRATRAFAEAGEFAKLLDELVFGKGTRQNWRRSVRSPSMKLLAWQSGYPEPAPAPRVLESRAQLVLGARTRIRHPWRNETAEKWEPASNRAVARGTASEVYARVAPAVVVVRTGNGYGTGFLIGERRILTNRHVVGSHFWWGQRGEAFVRINTGRADDEGFLKAQPQLLARVVHADARRDLALLDLTEPGRWQERPEPLALADESAKPGATCFAIGHPGVGLLWSVRQGMVSSAGRWPQDDPQFVVFRLLGVPAAQREAALEMLEGYPSLGVVLSNCSVKPGDSGGPLVDDAARLIAVTYAHTPATDFSWHVHSKEVKGFLAAAPATRDAGNPLVPDPARLGPWVIRESTARLGRIQTGSAESATNDLLCAGERDPERGHIRHDAPFQVFLDLDDDSKSDPPDPAAGFDAEIAFYRFPGWADFVYYDSNEDGRFDLALVDLDRDGGADYGFVLSGKTWTHCDALGKLTVDVAHLGYLDDPERNNELVIARGKLVRVLSW